jgi:DNA-binding response OmpR family regulator
LRIHRLEVICVRILVVDDDRTFCRLLAEVLEGRGYQVDWCSRALEGYKMSQPKHYDVMVFDVRMPVLLGTELAAGLTKQSPGSRIILISAFADEVLQKAAKSLGVPLLSKPFTTEGLLGVIAEESHL